MQGETHTFMDGKVHLYKRERSRFWQCSTYMDGRNLRVSTKAESLTMAKEFAREWYMAAYIDASRRNQHSRISKMLDKFNLAPENIQTTPDPRASRKAKPSGHTFREAAEKFIAEYGVITEGQRNKAWTSQHTLRARVHLIPYFGDKPISEINAGLFQEYRMFRLTNGYKGRKPSRSTLHHETVTTRLILKTAQRHEIGRAHV